MSFSKKKSSIGCERKQLVCLKAVVVQGLKPRHFDNGENPGDSGSQTEASVRVWKGGLKVDTLGQ